MAALDQANAARGLGLHLLLEELLGPGAGGVDQAAGAYAKLLAADLVFQPQVPQSLAAARRQAAGTDHDAGTVGLGSKRVSHHQAGVVDPAIGIFEAVMNLFV